MKALIQGTRICDLVDDDKTFEVHADLKWVDVSDGTTQQDTYVDGKVVKKPDPPTPTTSEAALAQIGVLEAEVTQRRQREAGADDAGGSQAGRDWMKAQEAKIATERDKL